jgi:pilus assembly protein TadC
MKDESMGEGPSISERPFRRVGAALPKALLAFFSVKLRVAGIRKDVRVWAGARALLAFFFGSLLLSLYLVVINPIATPPSIAISFSLFSGGFFFVVFVSYLQLYYNIVNRTTQLEKVLPDFLLLTVSNLRAGMSPFASFVHGARAEFGPFYDELRQSAARSGGKSPLSEALSEVSSKFDSPIFLRIVSLFSKGLRSGGHLAKLLTSIAQDVRRIQDLRAELTSSTRTYTIFLGFILVIIMPFLLSISTHFVTVFIKINKESISGNIPSSANLQMFSGHMLITASDMVLISTLIIIINSFFVSTLIGVITRGRALYGVKYFPLLAIGSLIMFQLSKMFIDSFLSGFSF